LLGSLDIVRICRSKVITSRTEGGHVGAAESVDALFLVTDQEDVLSIKIIGVTGSQEFDELPLEQVSILHLVDHYVLELRLNLLADAVVRIQELDAGLDKVVIVQSILIRFRL